MGIYRAYFIIIIIYIISFKIPDFPSHCRTTKVTANSQAYSTSYPKAKLNLYTTNYIGFASQKDLKTFIDNFNEDDLEIIFYIDLGKKYILL